MRQIFYESSLLGKVLYIKDVQSLGRQDLNVLDRELNLAIENMRNKMHEERDTDDTEWLHKLSMKLKICERFVERIKEVRDEDLPKLDAYHLSYFRQAVSNLIGPLQADQLFDRARQQAMIAVNKESEG